MFPRAAYHLLTALAAFLISCSKEQQPAKDTPTAKPATPESVGPASVFDTTLAGRYLAQAEQFAKEAQYDSAIVRFEKARGLYETEQNWEKYVRCSCKIGASFIDKVDYVQAVKYLSQALEAGMKKLGENHPEIAGIYYHFGMAHHIKRAYDEAIKFFNQALCIQIATLGEQHPEVAQTYHRMGVTYADQGDYNQALVFHQKALSIQLGALGDQHPDVARTYSRMGVVYRRKGDHERALVFINRALVIGRITLGDRHPKLAGIYHNLGNVYFDQRDFDQALRCYENSLAINLAKLGEQHLYVSYDYNNIGNAYQMKGDFVQALRFLQKSVSIKRTVLGEQHSDVAMGYGNIGEIYRKKGDSNRALRFYQKALAIHLASPGTYHSELAEIYISIGDVYENRSVYDQAMVFYQQAINASVLEFSNRTDNPTLNDVLFEQTLLASLAKKAETLANRFAKQSHHLHDLEAAVSTYRLASQLIDQMRSGYKAQGSKLFLAQQATQIYDEAIQASLQLHRATQRNEHKDTAFQFAEKSKAGVMLEALSEAEAKQFAGIPDSLLAQERQLRLDLTFYDKSLIEEKLQGEAGDSAKIALWENKVFNLKQTYEALLQRFEQEYPDYYNLKYRVNTASVQEVQEQLLDDEAALVEYFTGKDSIFIFALKRESFAISIVAKDSLFARQVEQLRHGIVEQNYAAYTQAAYYLYQTLLAPVADKLNAKHLIIIPDAMLSAIPFEALLTQTVSATGGLKEYLTLPYLMEEYTISYAYSAVLLQQKLSKKNITTKRDYLAFAPVFSGGLTAGTRGAGFFKRNLSLDSTRTAVRRRGYLPTSKKEVTCILDRFKNSYGFFERWLGQKSQVHLEHEANEENLKSPQVSDYRYLHFATHGLVNEKQPALSGLILASKDTISNEDGILHLGEIYNLNLNADLVVLSACETGLGQIAQGEGIIGLTRGFLYAGAANVLVSLWQVSDMTTSDLMVDFYDKMLGGMGKAEALCEAKRQMIRRDPGYAKPYYWAGFILTGRQI